MGREKLALIALVLGGCVAPRSGQFTCADGRCPDGLVCVDARCVDPGSEGDAGPDAEVGMDAGPLDAGPDAGPDAGTDAGTDAGGRMDSGADGCTSMGAESCARLGDEDCDGAIDEGCALSFSGAHMTTRLLRAPRDGLADTDHMSPQLSADGRDLYFASSSSEGGALWVAERRYDGGTGTYGEFNAPTAILLVSALGSLTGVSITGDGLEVLVGLRTRGTGTMSIQSFTHESPAVDFTTRPVTLSLPDAVAPQQPTVSRDGLELIVVVENSPASSFGLRHYRRSSREESWRLGPAVGGATAFASTFAQIHPRLSADALTLWLADEGTLMMMTRPTRADPFTNLTPAPAALTTIMNSSTERGEQPFLHPESGELWFVRATHFLESPQLGSALMRARMCRTETCAEPAGEPCGGGEQPTPFQCFRSITEPLGMGEVPIQLDPRCPEGGHLASLHTLDETRAVGRLYPGGSGQSYLGLVGGVLGEPAWLNGDSYFGDQLAAGSPALTGTGALFDVGLSVWVPGSRCPAGGECRRAGVCEREVWPTWPAAGPR